MSWRVLFTYVMISVLPCDTRTRTRSLRKLARNKKLESLYDRFILCHTRAGIASGSWLSSSADGHGGEISRILPPQPLESLTFAKFPRLGVAEYYDVQGPARPAFQRDFSGRHTSQIQQRRRPAGNMQPPPPMIGCRRARSRDTGPKYCWGLGGAEPITMSRIRIYSTSRGCVQMSI